MSIQSPDAPRDVDVELVPHLGAELLRWNPVRAPMTGRPGRLFPRAFHRRVNNFGDMLGPALVRRMLEAHPDRHGGHGSGVLVSIGSVMHFARAGDAIWGTGFNGRKLDGPFYLNSAAVSAVRGPKSANMLRELGHRAPEVFGDPGLLTSRYWARPADSRRSSVLIVPNLHDYRAFMLNPHALDPRTSLDECIARIASADLVVGSSLHGVIIAESFGVPARLVQPGHEPKFKYDDYYRGTGRQQWTAATTVRDAVRLGGEPAPVFDADALVDAFPWRLWRR